MEVWERAERVSKMGPEERDRLELRNTFSVGVRFVARDAPTQWSEGPVLREIVQVLEGDRVLIHTPTQLSRPLVPYTLEEVAGHLKTRMWMIL